MPAPATLQPRKQLLELHVKNLRVPVNFDDKLLRLVRLFLRSFVCFENRPRTARRLIETCGLNFR
jgi:hypothetical protein